MTINQFNTTEGLSIFEERNLKTQFHAHPATELIIAKQGQFTIETKDKRLENLQIGLIQSNVLHAFDGENATCTIIMLEAEFIDSDKVLVSLGELTNRDGIIALDTRFIEKIRTNLLKEWSSKAYQKIVDERIKKTIQLIKERSHQSDLSLADLAKPINLSASRLSHLFKAQMGISIQKYIIWVRMKVATTYMINENMHLTKAAYQAGFYDSAHFSKHFKELFGIKPSLVYNNSCIVQES